MSSWFDISPSDYLSCFEYLALRNSQGAQASGASAAQPPSATDLERIKQILYKLFSQDIEKGKINLNEGKSSDPGECQICFETFQQTRKARRLANCGHSTVCSSCWENYLIHRIEGNDFFPFIPCPEPGCRCSVALEDFFSLPLCRLEEFSLRAMKIFLSQKKQFSPCCNNRKQKILRGEKENERTENSSDSPVSDHSSVFSLHPDDCPFGFLEDKKDKILGIKCPVCKTKQVPLRSPVDPELSELVKGGLLRPCPVCSTLQGKDFGLCNLLRCPNCFIFWNFRTRETGTSEAQLKARARMSGSLWEPGELSYQMKLEREKPEEFKKLLKQNGIEYDPKYIRGR